MMTIRVDEANLWTSETSILLRLRAQFAEEPTDQLTRIIDQGLPFGVLHWRDDELASLPPNCTSAEWKDFLCSGAAGFEQTTAELIAHVMDSQPLVSLGGIHFSDPIFHDVPLTQHDHHRWRVLQYYLQRADSLMESALSDARREHAYASLWANIDLDSGTEGDVLQTSTHNCSHSISTAMPGHQATRASRCAECAQSTNGPLTQDTDNRWYCTECWRAYYSTPSSLQRSVAEFAAQGAALQQHVQTLQEKMEWANSFVQSENQSDHVQHWNSQEEEIHTSLDGNDLVAESTTSETSSTYTILSDIDVVTPWVVTAQMADDIPGTPLEDMDSVQRTLTLCRRMQVAMVRMQDTLRGVARDRNPRDLELDELAIELCVCVDCEECWALPEDMRLVMNIARHIDDGNLKSALQLARELPPDLSTDTRPCTHAEMRNYS